MTSTPFNKIDTNRIRNETLEKFPYFIKSTHGKTEFHTKVVSKSFSILYIFKVLDCLNTKAMSFSELYLESGIGMKITFLRYINLCRNFLFIQKEAAGNHVFYSITERGKILLNLFEMEE